MKNTVLVLGCGGSGVEASKLLLSQGIPVILYDGNEALDTEKVIEKIGTEVPFILGELKEEQLENIAYAVISPGISTEAPFVRLLTKCGVDVRSEIELAYQFEKGTVLGITGTNGKTTTTSLTGAIFKRFLGDENAFIAGNIGIPYTKETLKTGANTVSVLELSSFQLETVKTFHAHVSAILNITEDHLDRHHTMEEYERVKERITETQGPEDTVVLNLRDERLFAFGKKLCGPKVVWFSSECPKEFEGTCYYLENETFMRLKDGEREALFTTSDTSLVGVCNYENILAAVAISESIGVPMSVIREAVSAFRAVPHRIEFVREVNGVRYYNDSKGTNPDAAIQGIKAMTTKTVLIAGGYDKGADYTPWVELFPGRVKTLILLGQTREKIRECAEKQGFTDIVSVESLEEAVEKAAILAAPGDAVLLSPACASWGMFKNFEERGDLFKALVNRL